MRRGTAIGCVLLLAVAPLLAAAYLAPSADWSSLGSADGDAWGWAVAGGGDVNADGFDDVLVGVPGWDGGQVSEGAVLLYLGGPAGMSASPAWQAESAQAHGWLGSSVAWAGDLDGDGFLEAAAGAPGWDDALGDEQGAVFVFRGNATGLSSDPPQVLVGSGELGLLGTAVSSAGDVDGDGLSDLLGGEPGLDVPGEDAGGVLLWRGAATGGVDPLPLWSWSGIVAGDEVGAALAAAGDVDGDGFADFVVGAPGWSSSAAEEGAALLFRGGPAGPSLAPDWVQAGGSGGHRFGSALALGDFDNDGDGDLAVGAPGGDPAGALSGRVLVFADAGPMLGNTASVTIEGVELGSLFGAALCAPGDLDGDGYGDLVVGAPWGDGTRSDGSVVVDGGVAGVFPGSLAGPALAAATWLEGGTNLGGFGASLAPAGDVDGDLRRDLLLGGPWTFDPLGYPVGGAFIHLGLAASMDADDDGWCADPSLCPGGLLPGDCDDSDPLRHPTAVEICDGIDQDCNGQIPTVEQDPDGDGWSICMGDCDPAEFSVHPEAEELCDGVDQDCDGDPDNDVPPEPMWPDQDDDGHGTPTLPGSFGCGPAPPGWSYLPDDCDDTRASVHPGAPEIGCNALDDDCSTWTSDVPDRDGDLVIGCEDCSLIADVFVCGDCDDEDPLIGPQMEETCGDGVDQDCSGADLACDPPPPCEEPDRDCEEEAGCVCSQASDARGLAGALAAAGGLALLGAGRRRARRERRLLAPVSSNLLILLALFVAFAPEDAAAGDADLDTELLRPSFSPWGFLGATGAEPGHARSIRAGGVLQFELAPMVVVSEDLERAWLVTQRTSLTLGAFAVPRDGFGVGLSLPLYFQSGDWEGWQPPPAALGDLQVEALLRPLHSRNFALAIGGEVFVPTSTPGALVGERLPRGGPSLTVQGIVGPVTAVAELGSRFRFRVHTGYDFDLGSELSLLLGLRAWPKPGKVAIIGELESRAALSRFLKPGAENPLELRLGLRFFAGKFLQFDVGGGSGLNSGYGAPLFRFLLGVSFRATPKDRPPPEPAMPRVEEDFEEPEPEPVPEPPAPAPPEEPEPEPPPEAPALAKIVGDRIEIAQEIQFQHDSDVILPDSYWVLVAIQTVLDEHPEVAHLLIEGHASVEGSIEYNWDLSNRRAAAVFRWLVDAGVNSSRLSWRGMGEVIPRGRGHGDAQRHGDVRDMDRRVEFHIVRRLEQWVDETPDWSRDAPPVPWRTPEEELEAEAARAAGALGGPAAAPEAEPGSSPEPSLEPAPPLDDEERMEALQRAVESDRAGDRQTADDDRGDDDSGDDDSAPGDEDWEPLIPDEEDPFEEEDDDSSTPGEAP